MGDIVGRITNLGDAENVKKFLNLDEEEIHGKIDVDKIRKWWKESMMVGNISNRIYRSLDEFEEFVKQSEGLK